MIIPENSWWKLTIVVQMLCKKRANPLIMNWLHLLIVGVRDYSPLFRDQQGRGNLKQKALSHFVRLSLFCTPPPSSKLESQTNKKAPHFRARLFVLVGVSRFELPTPRPPDEYSKPGWATPRSIVGANLGIISNSQKADGAISWLKFSAIPSSYTGHINMLTVRLSGLGGVKGGI